MDSGQLADYWNQNAETWTLLARQGYDIYRDHLNTPAFLQNIPKINGLTGLDIGCGEGHNTRLLARRGASMFAIDISEVFIQHAIEEEKRDPLGIKYQQADAIFLPFEDERFDFATSFMTFMDFGGLEKALAEVHRVLRSGGFFYFSISHPCFTTPHRKNLRDHTGNTYAIEVGDYFKKLNGKIEEWIFKSAPISLRHSLPKFRIPIFNRALSEWVNAITSAGLTIHKMYEPCPDEETIRKWPGLQDSSVVPYFLHLHCNKK